MIRILLLIALTSLLCACPEKKSGPLERAGARADEIVDNAEEGKPLLHRKGPAESAGEALDEALDAPRRD